MVINLIIKVLVMKFVSLMVFYYVIMNIIVINYGFFGFFLMFVL